NEFAAQGDAPAERHRDLFWLLLRFEVQGDHAVVKAAVPSRPALQQVGAPDHRGKKIISGGGTKQEAPRCRRRQFPSPVLAARGGHTDIILPVWVVVLELPEDDSRPAHRFAVDPVPDGAVQEYAALQGEGLQLEDDGAALGPRKAEVDVMVGSAGRGIHAD